MTNFSLYTLYTTSTGQLVICTFMADDRSRRSVRRVDYKQLAEGPSLKSEREKSHKWSTKKLFSLEILDTKTEDNVTLALVHYTGWANKYNEWRPLHDIVTVPTEFIESTPEATSAFYKQLSVNIKENLSIARKTDSLIELRLPIAREAFHPLEICGISDKRGSYSVKCLNDLDAVLGERWFFRVINKNRDFAFVVEGSVSYRVIERRPLIEFTPDQDCTATYVHRGFHLVFKFVRDRGNASDLNHYLQI